MAEPFAELLHRHAMEEHGTEVLDVCLSTALADKDDPLCLLTYIASLGIIVRSVDDLLRVNRLEDEEELSAHPVLEGVAISIASEGSWVLFRP